MHGSVNLRYLSSERHWKCLRCFQQQLIHHSLSVVARSGHPAHTNPLYARQRVAGGIPLSVLQAPGCILSPPVKKWPIVKVTATAMEQTDNLKSEMKLLRLDALCHLNNKSAKIKSSKQEMKHERLLLGLNLHSHCTHTYMYTNTQCTNFPLLSNLNFDLVVVAQTTD